MQNSGESSLITTKAPNSSGNKDAHLNDSTFCTILAAAFGASSGGAADPAAAAGFAFPVGRAAADAAGFESPAGCGAGATAAGFFWWPSGMENSTAGWPAGPAGTSTM